MVLVIVESPAKAKTIEKYLGKGYKVMASKGHVVDLPKSDLGIDVEKNYEPIYVVTKEKSLEDLQSKFKEADALILAVDSDREGEAIGWHIARELGLIDKNGKIKPKQKQLQRIVFTEITKEAIKAAVENPREIDMNLVNAQQARRVLDRLVGYKLSPLLWKKIRFGLSAGRVQSVAVRLIVDREEEREKFDPEEYWSLFSYLLAKKSTKPLEIKYRKSDEEKDEESNAMKFELSKIDDKKAELKDQKQVEKIVSEIEQEQWIVNAIENKEVKRSPKTPFTTSTMQQAAANRLGLSAKNTMRIAQKLYEAGLITYMRTDSTNLAASAVEQARKFITQNYGDKYLSATARQYKTQAKVAQEAHEAIRPTDFNKVPKLIKLGVQEQKVYNLIWSRALASQMASALLERSKVVIDVKNYKFQLTGQRVLFEGFLKIYSQSVNEFALPALKVGQELFPEMILGQQHFTQPPARYSEATLIKALESFGIGRPSTYAPTISTILSRKYVEKEGKYLFPTDTGRVVNKLLVKHFPEIVDTGFTAQVEEDLDKVANGERDWKEMMDDFYTPFAKHLEIKDEELKREDFTVLGKSEYKCPVCGKAMITKLGRYGRFLSCSDFPECKGMRGVDGRTEEEVAKDAYSKDFLSIYQEAPKTDDGRDYLLKTGRYGRFWAHPDYPKVKDAKPLEYNKEVFKKIYGVAPKAKDGKKMILRRGRFGEFWAHPKYPDKKEVVRINKKEVAEKKKELGIEE
ncbi:type I DNA topoisomerase [Candidatus Dojkabacteria bacterium]|uniref:DNA topoisomerase 1 n=1 Tax=Candidatus Dojkabacteria bacterium TaxID=2099670 RepID=A0A955L5X9_9BACT|nr:type I DNA topoisomerase [Candidatus Dojkabacteria bacterium]